MAIRPARSRQEVIGFPEPSGTISPGLGLREFGDLDIAQDDLRQGERLIPATPPMVMGDVVPGRIEDWRNATSEWHDLWHVIPRELDLGSIAADLEIELTVFSAWRREIREWTSFANNGGAGVSVSGLPGLPVQVSPFDGYTITINVSTDGAAAVDGSLEFVFDGVDTISIPVSLIRTAFWNAEPTGEGDFEEVFGFETAITSSLDGTEKRQAIRPAPVLRWNSDYRQTLEGRGQTFENVLFDFQHRRFATPVRTQWMPLTADVTAGDTIIPVVTEYRDLRIGGAFSLALSDEVFDVSEIADIAPTTVELVSPVLNDYPAGTIVYPLLTTLADARIRGTRWPVNLREWQIEFTSTENDVDYADTSAWPEYQGKVLLDDFNALPSGTLSEDYRHDFVEMDNTIGNPYRFSFWGRHKRSHQLTVRALGKQGVWELRQLIYALRGRQVSFYKPTHSDDLRAAGDVVSGTNVLNVLDWGYSRYVGERTPRNIIRLTEVSGTTHIRVITASSQQAGGVDQLELDDVWPATIAQADVERIEYVEKVRLDTDSPRIRYLQGNMDTAYLVAPVRVVFE